MRRAEMAARPTPGRVALRGAGVAILAVAVYTLAFLGYAVVRSSATLLATVNEDAGLLATLAAVWVSLSVPALTIALLMCLLAAPLGAVSALAIWAASSAWNQQRAPGRALAIGAATCAALSALLVGLLVLGLGLAWTPTSAEALTFWLALPLLVYMIAGGAASWALNRNMRNNDDTTAQARPNRQRAAI